MVVLAYVLVLSVALVGIGDRNRFNRLERASWTASAAGSCCAWWCWPRCSTPSTGCVACVVEVAPSLGRHDVRLRAGVLFLTWALAIPAAVMIVWPWVSETFR